MKPRDVIGVMVPKRWVEAVNGAALFSGGVVELKENAFVVGRLLSETGFGLWVEALGGFGKRDLPMQVLIPWSVILTVTTSPIMAEQAKQPGFLARDAAKELSVATLLNRAEKKSSQLKKRTRKR